MEFIKIFDQRVDLTEEQFVTYLNSAFSDLPEDEIIVYDIDENGHRGPYLFQLIEDIQSHFDKRFILAFGSIDSIGERIGHLEVYNTRSKPPRYILMVKQFYAGSIKFHIEEMLTKLDLHEPASRKGNQGRKPHPGSEPAYKIWRIEDENNEKHVKSFNLFVKLGNEGNKKEDRYGDDRYKVTREAFNKAMRHQRMKEEDNNPAE